MVTSIAVLMRQPPWSKRKESLSKKSGAGHDFYTWEYHIFIFSSPAWTFLPSRKYFLSPKLPQLTWQLAKWVRDPKFLWQLKYKNLNNLCSSTPSWDKHQPVCSSHSVPWNTTSALDVRFILFKKHGKRRGGIWASIPEISSNRSWRELK